MITFLKKLFESSWEPITYKHQKFLYSKQYWEVRDSAYRIHKKTKHIQKYAFDSQGGCWYYISQDESDIIKQIMRDNDGMLPDYDDTSKKGLSVDPMTEADKGCDPITGI